MLREDVRDFDITLSCGRLNFLMNLRMSLGEGSLVPFRLFELPEVRLDCRIAS